MVRWRVPTESSVECAAVQCCVVGIDQQRGMGDGPPAYKPVPAALRGNYRPWRRDQAKPMQCSPKWESPRAVVASPDGRPAPTAATITATSPRGAVQPCSGSWFCRRGAPSPLLLAGHRQRVAINPASHSEPFQQLALTAQRLPQQREHLGPSAGEDRHPSAVVTVAPSTVHSGPAHLGQVNQATVVLGVGSGQVA